MNEPASGPVGAAIKTKLETAFAPERLALTDESNRHAGHAGHRPEGETHFRLEMTSSRFAGLGRVARQRAVHQVLAAELAGRVHALSLHLRAPGED